MSKHEDIDSMMDFMNLSEEDASGGGLVPVPIRPEDLEEEASGENTLTEESYPDDLPLLPLKNMVLFPGIVAPVTVGRDKSIQAIRKAYEDGRYIAVVSQRRADIDQPQAEDMYEVGVVAHILKMMQMPDGNITAFLQGRSRMRIQEFSLTQPYLRVRIKTLNDVPPPDEQEFSALASSIKEAGEAIIHLSPNIPQDAIQVLRNIDNPVFLVNFIGGNLNVTVKTKQTLLEIDALRDRAEAILRQMHTELQILELKNNIDNKVRTDLEKQQRDYFLQQQIKTIQEELGQNPQQEDLEALESRAAQKQWSKETAQRFERELKKLRRTNPQAPDYSVQMNYLELMLDLPWGECTEDIFDLKRAEDILHRDHFGLDKVKDRILEYLAVLQLRRDMKAPILCLVGPPGVGKTSLGRSVADALGRKYVRMSLGGLHDESELRGHRRTYIGALPGRILQSLKKAGSSNPVFILDEIDKIGNSHRGDPSSALLEILDPEQNGEFYDNYLETEYDLSKVLFIATANTLSTVQPALLDRMEIIEVSGYSVEEKVEIAKRHLLPKQLEEHGLKPEQISIPEPTLVRLAQWYTRESGVRSLERELARLLRSLARKIAVQPNFTTTVQPDELTELLGERPYSSDAAEEDNLPGVAVGLAWTSVGGDILFVEASLSAGKGALQLTGNLGEVMKESASTALSFLRAHADRLGIDPERLDKTNVHIHVPAGAIPKDGPSAGVTMLAALASAFTGRPLRPLTAMTGEITLRGKVLPVGGIKEKLLAAKRAGIRTLLLCAENERHVCEIPAMYLEGLEFVYVKTMTELLDQALQAPTS